MRRFHSCARLRKNPYFFYDLQAKQGPLAHSNIEDEGLVDGRRTFDPLVNQSKETMAQRVSKVFGSLGSREESRKAAESKGITVGGIRVPAKPEEPTNCCMSGCVNCVWELYNDEIEEWKDLKNQARKLLCEPKFSHVKWPIHLGTEPAGRNGNPTHEVKKEVQKEEEDDEEDGLNIGIRVFIETEKRIRARKAARNVERQAESTTS